MTATRKLTGHTPMQWEIEKLKLMHVADEFGGRSNPDPDPDRYAPEIDGWDTLDDPLDLTVDGCRIGSPRTPRRWIID